MFARPRAARSTPCWPADNELVIRCPCARRRAGGAPPAAALARADDRAPAAALVPHDPARAAPRAGRRRRPPVGPVAPGPPGAAPRRRWSATSASRATARTASACRRRLPRSSCSTAATAGGGVAGPRARRASQHRAPTGRGERRPTARAAWRCADAGAVVAAHPRRAGALRRPPRRRQRRAARSLGRPRHASASATCASTARGGDFAIAVNGVPVFCRGACWTPLDPVSLARPRRRYRAAVRPGARRRHEHAARRRHDGLRERRLLRRVRPRAASCVWQDFMFANMDYPAEDAGVRRRSVRSRGCASSWRACRAGPRSPCSAATARASSRRPCGARRASAGARPCSTRRCRRWRASWLPGVPYWPSSAHGGAFPHQGDAGTDLLLRRRRLPAPARGRAPRRGALRHRVPRLRQRARGPLARGTAGRPGIDACTTRLEGALAARPGRGLGLRRCARPLPGAAVRRRPAGAPLRRPRPLPRARPGRDRRGHGAGLRRVAAGALDLPAAGSSGSCAISGRAPAGASSTPPAGRRRPGTTCGGPWRRWRSTSPTRAATAWASTWPTTRRRRPGDLALDPVARRRGAGRAAQHDRSPATPWRARTRRGRAVRRLQGPLLRLPLRPALARRRGGGAETADGRDLARSFWFVGGWPSARELDVGLSAELQAGRRTARTSCRSRPAASPSRCHRGRRALRLQ